MRYVILIAGDEKSLADRPAAEIGQIQQEFRAYGEALKREGHYVTSTPLQPASTATTLRRRHGKLEMVDGPFAETKEQLGGFFLIEAKDLDEALAVAGRCPGASFGSVELRPARPSLL